MESLLSVWTVVGVTDYVVVGGGMSRRQGNESEAVVA